MNRIKFYYKCLAMFNSEKFVKLDKDPTIYTKRKLSES